MEWVKPISQVEIDVRRQGVFLLVDASGRRLRLYGFKRDQAAINRVVESLKDRCDEMVKYLIAQVRAEGETK